MERKCKYYDVIIVGAGVAGSALAHTLAKDGYKVHLIERNLAEPDRIVGELLQPGGYLKLVELGLQDCVDEIDAQILVGYTLYYKEKRARMAYPLENFPSDTAGRTFHHGRFVQRMRMKAASLSNVELEQGTVTSLIEERGTVIGVEYKTKATGQSNIASYAPLAVVCDGCFSNLRTSLCNPKVDTLSHFIALTLENFHLPQKNYAHLILEDPTALSFYAISSTEVRCMVDLPGQKIPSISTGDMARYLKTKIAPKVPDEFYSEFISAVDSGRIRSMPCQSMMASPSPIRGAILLGDALNMRHPLAGGGMMVALRDIVLLRDLRRPLNDLSDPAALSTCIERFYNSRKAMAFTANTPAYALYKLATGSKMIEELRELWFYYMSLGRFFVKGPISLLAGIYVGVPRLTFHGCVVALVFLFRSLVSNPSPRGLLATGRLIYDVVAISYPALQDEVQDMYFNSFKFPAANQNAPFDM